ncbi:MAG: DUF1351 domain-containing protein [Erysipelotrichaceae bacterium]|nr:DUF1351 domain-containing protein [Erysipelotrichaceae bacterium]
MNDIVPVQPSVAFDKAVIRCDFTSTDQWLDELEKRYKSLVIDVNNTEDRKAARAICADFRKCKKALLDEAKMTMSKATENIRSFEIELKRRLNRLESIREPLYAQIKPVKKNEPKPEKVSVKIKKCYMFEGDSEYIADMISAAIFNGIKVKEIG